MRIYDKLKRFEDDWDKEHKYNFEVLYYRKCWNLRGIIAEAIGGICDNGETTVEREDIPKIINALKSVNEDNWEDEGGSIWTWEEQKPHIKQHIKNLKYVYKLMNQHDIDVYFYDSY